MNTAAQFTGTNSGFTKNEGNQGEHITHAKYALKVF